MKVTIRKFEHRDIVKKVEWINNPENNQFLHYDLPLEVPKTEKWFNSIVDRTDRYDAVIEADGIPCGTIGLLNIDQKNKKAEYYIAMGEVSFKGKGISTQASKLLIEYAFSVLDLNKIYLFTESENVIAQKLFEKVGFVREGLLHDDIISRGRFIDRYAYGLTKSDYFQL